MNDQDDGADNVPIFSEFSDPRLVAIYDTVNPIAEYQTFYLELAARLSASSIIDIGCGTGLLSCELAKRGYRLIGVEPSKAMLDVARHRCGEQVEWIEGDALGLGEVGADLAIMTGHVAQIIRDDEVWSATLIAIREALGPGGRVAFESRNPLAREWTAWTPQASRRRVEDAVVGPVEVWFEDPRFIRELMRLGASAYLVKSSSVEHLIGAVRAAVFDPLGKHVVVGMPRGMLEDAQEGSGGTLSARELEILLLASRGLSNRQIATKLHLSQATIKRHLANTYSKMGVNSRGEAARMALSEGWITIHDVTEDDTEFEGD
jgi:DNA-binding CsgD family transcriptional regulator